MSGGGSILVTLCPSYVCRILTLVNFKPIQKYKLMKRNERERKDTGTLEESLFLYLRVLCPLFYRERGITGDWTANV